MTENILKLSEGSFNTTQRDTGAYSQIRGKGMHFDTSVYDAGSAGSLCLMTMRAMCGLMKMETAVFTPVYLDAPIFSCDLISVFGKDVLFLELYDTTLSHPGFDELDDVKRRYANLPDHDPGPHWYDDIRLPVSAFKKGRKLKSAFLKMLDEYSAEYFRILRQCPVCDPGEKKAENAKYVNGLLTNGGPAVDQFKKMLGDEKTAEFLRTVMFSC